MGGLFPCCGDGGKGMPPFLVKTRRIPPNAEGFFDDFVDLWVDGGRRVVIEVVSHGVRPTPDFSPSPRKEKKIERASPFRSHLRLRLSIDRKGFALLIPFAPAAEHGSGFPSPCGERAREALRACPDKYKLHSTADEIEAVNRHREVGQIGIMSHLQLLQR